MEPPLQPKSSDPLPRLSVFHFVLAGLTFLNGVWAFFAPTFMKAMNSQMAAGGTEEFQLVMIIAGNIALGFAIFSIVAAILLVIAGMKLRKTEGAGFCRFVAVVSLFLFPVGTALGIFTLVILSKPEVRIRFTQR